MGIWDQGSGEKLGIGLEMGVSLAYSESLSLWKRMLGVCRGLMEDIEGCQHSQRWP